MKLTYVAVSALMISVAAFSAHADSDNKVAYDERDNVVTNTFNNCVRTKWDGDNDVCSQAPAPKPVPQPVVVAPTPAPALPKINREARTVYFDFNKSTLRPVSVEKLDTLVQHINNSEKIIGAGIAGFADRIGSNEYNLQLSKKRTKSVYDYLSARVDIPTQILDLKALGESAPITDCSKSLTRQKEIECLQKDRRVEVIFQYQEK